MSGITDELRYGDRGFRLGLLEIALIQEEYLEFVYRIENSIDEVNDNHDENVNQT